MSGWDPYLQPGEQILWEGRPGTQLFYFRARDTKSILPTVILLGVAGFFVKPAMAPGADGSALVFGLVFFSFALLFSLGRYVSDWWVRRKTVYAISSDCVYIAKSHKGRVLTERYLDEDLDITLGESFVRFGPPGDTHGVINGRRVTLMDDNSFTFWALTPETAKEVYDIARRVKRSKTQE
ncbi:MAG: hypothetical protein AAGJ96_07040 [Pseudomonadota bacterium]